MSHSLPCFCTIDWWPGRTELATTEDPTSKAQGLNRAFDATLLKILPLTNRQRQQEFMSIPVSWCVFECQQDVASGFVWR